MPRVSKAKGYVIPSELVLYELEILPYPDKVLLSNKRRTFYKRWSKNRPKKYKDFGKDKQGWLVDTEGNRVIKNFRTAGKPRYYTLSGQDLWSFNIHPQMKSKVSEGLKKLYYENFRARIDPEVLSGKLLGIEIEFQGPLPRDKNDKIMLEDLDNMERWHLKAILDTLTGHVEFMEVPAVNKRGFTREPNLEKYPPFLVDDNLDHIRELPVRFTETEDTTKMMIRIYEVKL